MLLYFDRNTRYTQHSLAESRRGYGRISAVLDYSNAPVRKQCFVYLEPNQELSTMPPLVDSYSDGGQASSSATPLDSQCEHRPKPELPQPSFAPPSLKRCAPTPPQMIGTITPRSPLYTCPVKHLSLRLASSLSTAYVSRRDPSTSFYLYLPSSHPVSRRWRGDVPSPQGEGGKGEWDGYGEFKVVVLVHGSVRDAERLRNSWAERAEKEGVVIVAPLWPGTLDVSRAV